jgi:hypothetical protein
MRCCRWILAMLLMMSFLAYGSTSWADPKQKHRKDGKGCEDHWDTRPNDHPPGWDKGKKTGWQGQDLPPGQQKKYRQRYDSDPDWRRDAPRQEVIPVPVPVPVPR